MVNLKEGTIRPKLSDPWRRIAQPLGCYISKNARHACQYAPNTAPVHFPTYSAPTLDPTGVKP